MTEFLKLGEPISAEATQPSIESYLEFEGYETPRPPGRRQQTFVDWVLENGVTEPKMRVEKFSPPSAPSDELAGSKVADRRLLSDKFRTVEIWMRTHQPVRPIDVVVGALLFLVIAMATAHLLTPDPPTLPPLG